MEDREMAVERLRDIRSEIEELLHEAGVLLRGTGLIETRAERYWMAHIAGALSGDHECGATSMHTLTDTIRELEEGQS